MEKSSVRFLLTAIAVLQATYMIWLGLDPSDRSLRFVIPGATFLLCIFYLIRLGKNRESGALDDF